VEEAEAGEAEAEEAEAEEAERRAVRTARDSDAYELQGAADGGGGGGGGPAGIPQHSGARAERARLAMDEHALYLLESHERKAHEMEASLSALAAHAAQLEGRLLQQQAVGEEVRRQAATMRLRAALPALTPRGREISLPPDQSANKAKKGMCLPAAGAPACEARPPACHRQPTAVAVGVRSPPSLRTRHSHTPSAHRDLPRNPAPFARR
jgi:hypothetical protein